MNEILVERLSLGLSLRHENNELLVSTIVAHDTNVPETAIKHKSYNDGKFIIVEEYKSLESAVDGHNKWIKIMTSENLPESIKDSWDTVDYIKQNRVGL